LSFLATDTSSTDLTFTLVVLFKETMHLVSQYHRVRPIRWQKEKIEGNLTLFHSNKFGFQIYLTFQTKNIDSSLVNGIS